MEHSDVIVTDLSKVIATDPTELSDDDLAMVDGGKVHTITVGSDWLHIGFQFKVWY